MNAVIFILRRAGIRVNGKPLWISPQVYWDRSGGISLGDRCVVSHGVSFLTHDFSMDRVAEIREGISGEELSRRAPISVGDYAFIGMGVMILPGVAIGRGAIVGSGSVVTRDVGEDCVVAGNPARVISTTDEYWRRRAYEFVRSPRRR
ncbi:acyltransferase [Microbacterium schleiferi]|uniref:Acyltransferase n=2 Tax=Microbacterium schleiferi TaxID=69362 RepID=A0ABU7V5M5_9MICO